MILEHLADVIGELPYRIRDEIEGCVEAVGAAAPDIALESEIDLTPLVRLRPNGCALLPSDLKSLRTRVATLFLPSEGLA